MIIQRMRELPPNFGQFVEEIAAGVARLYGERASAHYRAHARRSMAGALAHSSVHAYAAVEGGETLAYLMGIERDGVVQVPFLHVLQPHTGRGLESELVREAVPAFWERDIRHILCEAVLHSPADPARAFAELGFECVPRQLMAAPVPAPRETDGRPGPMVEVRPFRMDEWDAAAACLVAAYAGDPGRRLHAEMLDVAGAADFIERVHAGSFGTSCPEFLVAAHESGACIGVALGSETAPGTGFVMQIGVRPGHRGRGVATTLIRALEDAFARRGFSRMGLGVTMTNPARRLYETLGFRRVQPLDAYIWWKPGALPPCSAP